VQGAAPKQQYSREEVRRALKISERQLRSWEREGLVQVATEYGFADLIALRTLKQLRTSRIPTRQIGRALASLRKRLADIERPLYELKIASDGRTITARVAGQKMEALSGQVLFDFETAELGSVMALKSRPAASPPQLEQQAEHWFQKGLAFEESGAPVERAVSAYMKAVELNPTAAGALVNLGTIHYRLRNFTEARKYYERALEADPEYPLVHFNLGNLCDEEGLTDHARESYQKALDLSPRYADAHFNLALLFEKTGNMLQAVHHWKTYLKLDPASSWSAIARRQLDRLRDSILTPDF